MLRISIVDILGKDSEIITTKIALFDSKYQRAPTPRCSVPNLMLPHYKLGS